MIRISDLHLGLEAPDSWILGRKLCRRQQSAVLDWSKTCRKESTQ